MSCVRFKFNGISGILTLADESEPFLFRGKRFVVNKMVGPAQVDRHGDPLSNQPSGRLLQAAYEHYMRMRRAEPPAEGGGA